MLCCSRPRRAGRRRRRPVPSVPDGRTKPGRDGKASGAFVGLTLFHRRAHLYRAVLEGVAFALQHNIEAGAAAASTLDHDLVVVGGAAHSDLWMQIIADITDRPVLTIRENVEAAMGAALFAAYGASLISADDVRRGWVTLAPRATPRPRAAAAYARLFGRTRRCTPRSKRRCMTLTGNGRCANRNRLWSRTTRGLAAQRPAGDRGLEGTGGEA